MARIDGSVAQRGDSYSFFIDWSESVDNDNNRSTVYATAYIYCSKHTAYASGLAQKLVIDGTEFTNTASVNLSSGVTVALISGSKTISHDSNGSKSIGISADCALPNGNGWGPLWGSAYAEVSLTNIPRHPVLTLKSIENIGLDSCLVRYKYESGQFYHLQYRINNGAWTNIGGNPTFSLTGLTPNTSYTIQVRGMNQDKTLVGNASNSLNFKTKDIAHASVDSNILYFPQPIKININNQANANVSALVFLNDEKMKEVTLSTGENTISFTEEEQTEIYKKFVSNKVTIKIIVKTNNKYEDTAISKEITFNGDRLTIYSTEFNQKGQLWKNYKKTRKLAKAIIWKNKNKGGNPIWKKAI